MGKYFIQIGRQVSRDYFMVAVSVGEGCLYTNRYFNNEFNDLMYIYIWHPRQFGSNQLGADLSA